jgi:hypothetical protein
MFFAPLQKKVLNTHRFGSTTNWAVVRKLMNS